MLIYNICNILQALSFYILFCCYLNVETDIRNILQALLSLPRNDGLWFYEGSEDWLKFDGGVESGPRGQRERVSENSLCDMICFLLEIPMGGFPFRMKSFEQ